MRHTDYIEAIESARHVTDIRDAEQQKRAANAKDELKKWWKDATVLYLKLVSNVDLKERGKNWRSYSWEFDLDDFGVISVQEYLEDERAPRRRVDGWVVNKADIFDMGQAYHLAVAQRNGEDVTLRLPTAQQALLFAAFISDETLRLPEYTHP